MPGSWLRQDLNLSTYEQKGLSLNHQAKRQAFHTEKGKHAMVRVL